MRLPNCVGVFTVERCCILIEYRYLYLDIVGVLVFLAHRGEAPPLGLTRRLVSRRLAGCPVSSVGGILLALYGSNTIAANRIQDTEQLAVCRLWWPFVSVVC